MLASHGTPMRRLIESGAVEGRNFVQVGLRGYWPPQETFDWMQEQGLRWHLMREIEERGAEAVIADAIAEALDGPDLIYLSIDIDVVDPGMAPGTGTPEPGGMLTRELLRAIRQIVGAVDLAGMDIVEVSPPYDQAETTADDGQPRRARGDQRAGASAARTASVASAGRADRSTLAAAGRPDRATADALARLYDLDLADDPGDLDLYLALAERTGGPILELAVGTGRLAVPLAERGLPRSPASTSTRRCSTARGAARPAPGGRLGPARRSSRPTSSACACPTRAATGSRSSPSTRSWSCRPAAPSAPPCGPSPTTSPPAGVAVVDVWLPDAEDLARFDGRLILEWPRSDPETGAGRDQGRRRPSTTRRPARDRDHDSSRRPARAGRPGAGSAATGCAWSRPTSSRRSPRTPASWSSCSPATTSSADSVRAASGRS